MDEERTNRIFWFIFIVLLGITILYLFTGCNASKNAQRKCNKYAAKCGMESIVIVKDSLIVEREVRDTIIEVEIPQWKIDTIFIEKTIKVNNNVVYNDQIESLLPLSYAKAYIENGKLGLNHHDRKIKIKIPIKNAISKTKVQLSNIQDKKNIIIKEVKKKNAWIMFTSIFTVLVLLLIVLFILSKFFGILKLK